MSVIILGVTGERISAQPEFPFQAGFPTVFNSPLNEVFDVSSDGRLAVILTSAETGPPGPGQVTVIDTVSGTRLDTKLTARGVVSVRIAELEDGLKVLVLTNDSGNHHITIYDLALDGVLTERSHTQLNNNPGISILGSRIQFSRTTRTGFVSLSSGNIRLVSFSLDSGALLQTLVTPVSAYLNLYEDAGRKILVGGLNRTVVFIDYSNPSAMVELGRVQLPSAEQAFGTWEISTVFSPDGNTLFAGNGYTLLSAIDTNTRQIQSSANSSRYRVRQLKGCSTSSDFYLVMRGLEDGGNALKGFALFNANVPAALTFSNEIVFGEDIFAMRDFAVSRDCNKIFVGSFGKITAYSLPQFERLWAVNLAASDVARLVTIARPGDRERIFGAWFNKVFSFPLFRNNLSNFDGDYKSDMATFRPSDATWKWRRSADQNQITTQFGNPNDVPVAADFDGDMITDPSVYRPTDSKWYVKFSSTGLTRDFRAVLGANGASRPMDHNGDRRADLPLRRLDPNSLAVLDPMSGTFLIRLKLPFRQAKMVIADFDGDEKADVGYFYRGLWSVELSADGRLSKQFGTSTDIPVPGDYDLDGKDDVAVFSPNNSSWMIDRSFFGGIQITLGQPGDMPVPADYDGDGKIDLATYRPQTFTWTIRNSTDGVVRSLVFGGVGEIPVAAR